MRPVALSRGAVALVEPCGDLLGAQGKLGGDLGGVDVRAVPADHDAGLGLGGQPKRERPRRGELHLDQRRRRLLERCQMPLHEFDGTRGVAGAGAELHVRRDRAQLPPLGAQPAIGAPVRLRGLGEPAGAHVGQQQVGQDRLRLLDTRHLTGEHRHRQRDGVLVAPPPGQVAHLRRRLAPDAVRHPVTRRRAPQPVVLGGRVLVADVLRHDHPVLVHGVHAVAGQPVPALHVVEHGHRLVQRNLGELRQRVDDPLEAPHQLVVVVRVGLAAVVHREAPGEGHERLARLAAHHVRVGRQDPRRVLDRGVRLRVGATDDRLHRGDLAAPVRHPPCFAEPLLQRDVIDHECPPQVRPTPAGRGTSGSAARRRPAGSGDSPVAAPGRRAPRRPR
ncbi:hypothetical protein EV193_104298 [Herbihabitans rhizosphaerae]|uniref:Uncharacterized protein n=1 Tax=Herbihabitans rhizosphaerae TaxID=1872711 RepID=A0A4Q7KRI8_9PSEU|nr:hypothetical protein EV193_104298 [Herbihabitans rhizosphaerae]